MAKNAIKITLDIIMTIIFILLMNLSATGMFWHEFLGLFIFVLFFMHKLLNWQWIEGVTRSLFSGRLKTRTKFIYTLDVLLVVFMGMTIISGILISQSLFPFLASSNKALWSALHTSFSYSSLILISLHLGMHWKSIMTAFRKMFKIRNVYKPRTLILRSIAAILVIFGIKASIGDNIGGKVLAPLTLTSRENKMTIRSTGGTTELYDTNKLSTSIKLVSTDSAALDGGTSLEDYLGRLVCTACHRRCSLLSPACGKGVRQAEMAKNEYYTLLEQSQSSTESESSTQSGDGTQNDVIQSESGAQSDIAMENEGDVANDSDNANFENNGGNGYEFAKEDGSDSDFSRPSQANNVINTFAEFIPMMTLYVAGTYYTVEFIEKRKRT